MIVTFVIFYCFLIVTVAPKSLDPNEIVVTILCEREGYHVAHAKMLKSNLIDQADALEKDHPSFILTSELNITGTWTITPMLSHLVLENPQARWFFFCTESTVVNLKLLLKTLETFDDQQNAFVGHALYDDESTIIHHFAEGKKFKYPNFASGFALSSRLIKKLSESIENGNGPKNDFSIDASYEFASFVLEQAKGAKLIHASEFCIVSNRMTCATYPRLFHACTKAVLLDKVFFAVKTCSKYHKERLSILKKTWAKRAKRIAYFTDELDDNAPSNSIVGPKTSQGHCSKTYAILEHARKELEKNDFEWLVISDDDTLFSISRLLNLLTCYNPENPVAIGERYGFRAWHQQSGYDYLTGGAGVALSAALVEQIIDSKLCECPTSTTPDDMFLFGTCLARVHVRPTHSSLFHQARPMDYASGYLAIQEPVSFHKFWMMDPEKVYNQWFKKADESLRTVIRHEEL